MGNHLNYIIKDRDQSLVSEAFRTVRARLQALRTERELKTVLFTGAGPGDSNTVTAANTAATLAYAGHRVILVDCDLHKPGLHNIFNLKEIGITNIINEGRPLEEVIQNSGIANLKILASGPLPEKPADLLSLDKLRSIIESLKTIADYVILNSPPLVVVSDTVMADACILASKVDGVILVVDARTVRTQNAKKVMELLRGARANIVGAILNDVRDDKDLIYDSSIN